MYAENFYFIWTLNFFLAKSIGIGKPPKISKNSKENNSSFFTKKSLYILKDSVVNYANQIGKNDWKNTEYLQSNAFLIYT